MAVIAIPPVEPPIRGVAQGEASPYVVISEEEQDEEEEEKGQRQGGPESWRERRGK